MAEKDPWELAAAPAAVESGPKDPWEKQDVSVAADVLKSTAVAVPKGIMSGVFAPGDVIEAAKGASKSKYNPFQAATQWFQKNYPERAAKNIKNAAMAGIGEGVKGETTLPTSSGIQKQIEKVTGDFYEPKTTAGKYAGSITESIANPISYVGPGGAGIKALLAGLGGAGGEAGEQLTGSPWGRIAGGTLASLVPRGAARTITPLPISKDRKDMVDILRKEGIEPTAGQVSGRKSIKFAESALGDTLGAGGKTTEKLGKIEDQVTRAALRRVGVNADRATPDVVNQAFRDIGGEFDRLAARNNARLDPAYMQEILNHQQQYDFLFSDPLKAPIVKHVIEQATNAAVKSPTMTGTQYKSVRSMIERMRRNRSTDPEVSLFLGEVRDSMDDLMERNIVRNNPADAGKWAEARRKYRNMLVIENAVGGSKEEAAFGIITPTRLSNAVEKQSKRNKVRGKGDFADLSRASSALLKPVPTSGTSERLITHAIPAALGGAAGTLAGNHDVKDILIMLGTAGAPAMSGRALMSNPVQNYLKNQRASGLLNRLPSKTVTALRAALGQAMKNRQQRQPNAP